MLTDENIRFLKLIGQEVPDEVATPAAAPVITPPADSEES
jgi:hypothetical protein